MSRIRADQLVNRAGSGGPKFPHGVAEGFSVSGVVTATSFAGNLTGNADTATTATNAQGITGTPNITVGTIGCGNVTSTGDVTGVNATFSGNLTVQGTTTTIDTAVTAVDSLAVDGSVGIGTTNPRTDLQVGAFGGGDSNIQLATGTSGASNILFGDGSAGSDYYKGFIKYNHSTDNLELYSTDDIIHYTSGTERFRITSGGAIQNYYNTNLPVTDSRPILQLGYGVIGDDSSGRNGVTCNAYPVSGGSSWHYIGSGSLGASRHELGFGDHKFYTAAAGTRGNDITWNERLRITSAGNVDATGTISDSIGPLRRLGIQGASGSFSFAADMAGKLVRSTGNGSTLTIPQNVFSAGDMISVFNVSTGDNTIAQGTGATLYNTADGATGNRTLGPKGVCTIVCTSTNEFIISGSQVS